MIALTETTFTQLAEQSLALTLGASDVVDEILSHPGTVLDPDAPDLLQQLAALPVLDVRTPGEFAHAHLLGAINLPLFTDEERAVVGTMYKQVGRDAAIAWGWAQVQPRLVELVDQARSLVPDLRAVVHCARGGLRSRSVAWLLTQAGMEVVTLRGGYKSIRRRVLAINDAPYHLMVLSGHTGSGKTAVLQQLAARGEQVLDLERLANHKGSAFGALGEAPQPSNEFFENQMASVLAALDPKRRIWVEDESLRIGNCAVPAAFWNRMRASIVVRLEIPAAARLAFSLATYGQHDVAELKDAVRRVEKRLGGLRVKQANQFLNDGKFAGAAAIMLDYYDQCYSHSLAKRVSGVIIRVPVESTDAQANAEAVLQAAMSSTGAVEPR